MAKTLKPRVQGLDRLRGFSVVSMVVYHAMYDLVAIFGVQAGWYWRWPGYVWQQSICWVFILVSGASMQYASRPVRRGLVVLGCGVLVSAVTYLFMPSQMIWFGVLHCIGACMIVCGALRKWLAKVPPVAGLVVSALLFVFLRGVPQRFVGLLDWPLFSLPSSLYKVSWLAPLGFPGPWFRSADYFPLVPWLFLFLAGWFGYGLVKGRVKAKPAARWDILARVGRHSLWIYVVHQPVIYGACLALEFLGVL